MLWFVQAYIETAHVKPRERAMAFVEAVSRVAGQEVSVAKLVPLRGSKMSSEEREALMLAAAVLEEMTPTLLAKVPPPE